jgi:hypothetical protein
VDKTTWSAVSRHAPDQRELERSASEHLVQRFGGEMRAASSSHDGVKGAVFPEFDARAPCGFEKIDKAAPIGGVMALLHFLARSKIPTPRASKSWN